MSKNQNSTAAQVRAFFAENPTQAPKGSEKSLAEGARGRLNPEAVEVFNAANPRRKYVTGTKPTIEVKVPSVSKSGRKSHRIERLTYAEVRALAGDAAKGRGILTAEAFAAAGEALAVQASASKDAAPQA